MVNHNAFEQRLEECRSEVTEDIAELERRLESVEAIQQLIHKIYESAQATEQRVSNLMISFSSYAAKHDEILRGFPNEDAPGHRRAHEAMITAAERRVKLYDMAIAELTKWGLIGLIGFVATAIWLSFKNEVHK